MVNTKQSLFAGMAWLVLLLCTASVAAQRRMQTDVLVVGGGTGGTAAALQSAAMGLKTLVVEGGPWLGGMISSAGVSAIDGNHALPSGIWASFRNQLYQVYGGPEAVSTGWVSHTLFEPHVADSIFKAMARRQPWLTVAHQYNFKSLLKQNREIKSVTFTAAHGDSTLEVKAGIVIDATELGDVMKAAGIPYDLGMEAGALTGEKAGVVRSSGIIQDLTYVAVLKDYGKGSNRTIPRPDGYDPAEFDGCCTDYYHDTARRRPTVDAAKMLNYGRLPRDKYMINWPIYGNDTYLDVIEMDPEQRRRELVKAKETTRRFVYFIQHQLGFAQLGWAGDEFPTADSLAIIPYYREGRRLKGLVRFTMRHIAEPFTYGDPLYRTGIAVGDYPIDHHHKKNPMAPQHLEFYPIPSFNVPLGALIPRNFSNLIVAEKGISVSNVVNGTTRLQPCVLLTGQAAGALAALSIKRRCLPEEVPVREVQNTLLDAGAAIMPYIDVNPEHRQFRSIQKIGATGILKGVGVPHQWANQTWFYPDSLVSVQEYSTGLNDFEPGDYRFAGQRVTIAEAVTAVTQVARKLKKGLAKNLMQRVRQDWEGWGLKDFDPKRQITRLELSVVLDRTLDPFNLKAVKHNGAFTN